MKDIALCIGGVADGLGVSILAGNKITRCITEAGELTINRRCENYELEMLKSIAPNGQVTTHFFYCPQSVPQEERPLYILNTLFEGYKKP